MNNIGPVQYMEYNKAKKLARARSALANFFAYGKKTAKSNLPVHGCVYIHIYIYIYNVAI
jgi:hypothetical protein